MKIEYDRIHFFRDEKFLVFVYDWRLPEFPKGNPYHGNEVYQRRIKEDFTIRHPPFPTLWRDLNEMDLFEVCLQEAWQSYQYNRDIGSNWTFTGGDIHIFVNAVTVPGMIINTQQDYDDYFANLQILFGKVQEDANNNQHPSR